MGEIFRAVLNERQCKWIERRVLGEEQNGFRTNRRAEDNMYAENETIERKKRNKCPLYLSSLDIEKAYDRVNRGDVQGTGEKSLREKIVRIIRSMFVDTKARDRLGTLRDKSG